MPKFVNGKSTSRGGVTVAAISRYQFYSLGAFVVSFQRTPGRFAESRPDASPRALQVGLKKRGGLHVHSRIAFCQWIIILGTILLLIISSSDEITQMFFVAILGDYAKPRGSRVSPFRILFSALINPVDDRRLHRRGYTRYRRW